MSVSRAVRRTREGRTAAGVRRAAAAHVVCFITGALVSRGAMLGSMSPFSAAFTAAVPFGCLPSGMLGAALSSLLLSEVNAFRYVAVVIAVGAIRWLFHEVKRVSGSRLFPPAAAFLPVFATGVALTFSARSELSDVISCFIEAVLAAAGAYFMSRTVELFDSPRRLNGLSQQELACLSMTGCILLLSLSPLTIGSVSVGRTLAALAVMLFARYGQVKGGSIAGIATGIVFALADVDMLFLSAGYSLSGLVGGLLAPMGKAAVVFSSMLCSVTMAFASGDSSVAFTIALETAAASAIFLLIPRDAGRYFSSIFCDEDRELSNEALRRNVTMRLDHCSKAVGNVASCVNAVSERLSALSEPLAERLCDKARESACSGCGLKAYCWDKQRTVTEDDMSRLGDRLREQGRVDGRDVDECFSKRCCKSSELAEAAARAYSEYLSVEAAGRRVTGVRSVVAGQFAGLSQILEDLAREFGEVEDYDPEAAERIMASLGELGLMAADCSCRRSRGRGMTVELTLAVDRKTAISKTQLVREVSRACGRYFSPPSISFEGDRARVAMSELPLYRLEIGSAQHICDDGKLCGDCLNYFDNGEGSSVALLSDGMGAGGRAAVDANMAVSIMTKLCKAGLSYDCSLAVVNASLMIKSEEETLATLDLADFNMFTGRLSLYKAGACATYILRGMRLMKKETPSLPLGILNEAKFARQELTLREDDLIIMISDGALIGAQDWLEKLILSSRESPAPELASAIVEQARLRRQGSRDDDISAIAMRVANNA